MNSNIMNTRPSPVYVYVCMCMYAHPSYEREYGFEHYERVRTRMYVVCTRISGHLCTHFKPHLRFTQLVRTLELSVENVIDEFDG